MTPPALPKKITKATAAIGSTTKGNSDNTDSGTGLLTCPHPGCGKVFTKPFAIRAHVKSHGAERTYRCELCESSFRRSHDLKRHFRSIHTVIKPFGCETCGKRFSRMDALKRHVKRQGTPCYVCTQ
ncbi:hypothetical protein DFS34DRAFT_574096 [Phlyctochytrium arcticum]|nr:hypothetical protein DFS34DRAFT_574096 [Phlyctochytrium arcticum]